MSKRHNKITVGTNIGTLIHKTPQRGEIWLVVDRDEKHNGYEPIYDSSVQGGTRTGIVVSNNTGNKHATIVEVVYTTTKNKNKLPTHFYTKSTPDPSTVLCEQIVTVAKKDLTVYYGTLNAKEILQLNKCLKVSLGLD